MRRTRYLKKTTRTNWGGRIVKAEERNEEEIEEEVIHMIRSAKEEEKLSDQEVLGRR